jgi:L-iditol 2-dehydrogenase
MADTMLAAVVEELGKVVVREVPVPKIGPYQALTRTLACAFCSGTDSHLAFTEFPFRPQFPFILGHEGVGEIIQVGEKFTKYPLGARVLRAGAAYPHGPEGAPNVGWGGFAEYGVVDDFEARRRDEPSAAPFTNHTMQQVPPSSLDAAEATILITIKETWSALRMANAQPGEALLILGTGPVAFSFSRCAEIMGLSPIVVAGRRLERLALAGRFGATATVGTREDGWPQKVKELTGGGAHLAIDTSGAREVIGDLLGCLRDRGRLGLYGVPTIGPEEFRVIHVDCSQAPTRWWLGALNPDEASAHEEVCAAVESGRLRPAAFVSHRIPIARFTEALEAVRAPDAVKVVVEFP